jgi:L-alanine-DL-glutamate epimerase-like enolase superfamily enzyme
MRCLPDESPPFTPAEISIVKITSARVIVTCPGRNFVTLEIETDQGVYGIGDGTLNGREVAVVSYLEDQLIPTRSARTRRRIRPARYDDDRLAAELHRFNAAVRAPLPALSEQA